MRRGVDGRALSVGAILVALSSAGCTSANTYATARTLAPGDVTSTVAVEGVAYHGSQGTGALPILPTYVFRIGVIDHVDFGARIGSLTELGADVKVNFLRGPLDLAVAGGAEAFLEWHYESHGDEPPPHRTGSRAWFHFPLIASYNFSKELSLVGTPGVTYVVGRNVDSSFVRTQPFDGDTLAARLGVGIDYRWKEHRAFHPEITWIQSLRAAETIVQFGIGFNFGDIPKYDDIGDDHPEPVRPPEAHPPESKPTPPPAPSPAPTPSAPPPPAPENPGSEPIF